MNVNFVSPDTNSKQLGPLCVISSTNTLIHTSLLVVSALGFLGILHGPTLNWTMAGLAFGSAASAFICAIDGKNKKMRTFAAIEGVLSTALMLIATLANVYSIPSQTLLLTYLGVTFLPLTLFSTLKTFGSGRAGAKEGVNWPVSIENYFKGKSSPIN